MAQHVRANAEGTALADKPAGRFYEIILPRRRLQHRKLVGVPPQQPLQDELLRQFRYEGAVLALFLKYAVGQPRKPDDLRPHKALFRQRLSKPPLRVIRRLIGHDEQRAAALGRFGLHLRKAIFRFSASALAKQDSQRHGDSSLLLCTLKLHFQLLYHIFCTHKTKMPMQKKSGKAIRLCRISQFFMKLYSRAG